MNDTTFNELDTFTTDMIRRVKEHKKNLDKLINSDDEDNVDISAHLFDNLVEDKQNKDEDTEQEVEIKDDEETHDSEFDVYNEENYRAHVRKSISALLNVHNSVLPHSEDELEAQNEGKPTSRLTRRLGKIAQLYSEMDECTGVLTENKVNITSKTNVCSAESIDDKPSKRGDLQDRLKDIARFYYPVENEEKNPSTKPSKVLEMAEKIQKLAVLESSQPKLSEVTKSNSILISQPTTISKSNIPTITTTTVVPVKKSSVSNLRQIFEAKAQSESDMKEARPELLRVRDKMKLFEKAIKIENEASQKQYRKNPPPKRLVDWKPTTVEVPIKRQKSITEEKKFTNKNDEVVCSDSYHVDRFDSDSMSVCSSLKSEQDLAVSFKEIKNELHNDDQKIVDEAEQSSIATDEQEQPTKTYEEEIDEQTAQQSVQEAFATIDSLPVDGEECQSDHSLDEITFSALDQGEEAIHRSSTKVDLKSDQEEIAPEKPPRLYFYENDEPEPGHKVEENVIPPLRTISFYRQEQKMRYATASKAPSGDSDQLNVIHLKQNIVPEQVVDYQKFIELCSDRIDNLKAEVLEHNRISGQAKTALNLCLTHPDLEFSEGRIEAERLLLISDEKRKACLAEIHKLKNMIKHPKDYYSKFFSTSSKGTLSISNLQIPLQKDFLTLRAQGKTTNTYHFLCLIYNGPKVFVSELLCSEKNAGSSNLEFKFGTVHCQDLNEDFVVRVQLFALDLNKHKDGHVKKSFRMKFGTSSLKRSIKHSPSITTNASADSPIPVRVTAQNTSFKSVGHVLLNLTIVRGKLSVYRLESNSFTTPITGYLTMNVSLQVTHKFNVSGYFDLKDQETTYWHSRWFVIDGTKLKYWRFEEEQRDKQPMGVIDLKHCINPTVSFLKGNQRLLCMRPYTFVLVTIQPPAVSNAYKLVKGGTITQSTPQLIVISSPSKEVNQIFSEQINQLLHNIRVWETDTMRPYSVDEFNRILNSHLYP